MGKRGGGSWLTGGSGGGDDDAERDTKHWEAVEEAIELLNEQRAVEAILELRRVIQDDPRNPYAFRFLGTALFDSEELEASRDAYRAAVALAPKYLGARVHL